MATYTNRYGQLAVKRPRRESATRYMARTAYEQVVQDSGIVAIDPTQGVIGRAGVSENWFDDAALMKLSLGGVGQGAGFAQRRGEKITFRSLRLGITFAPCVCYQYDSDPGGGSGPLPLDTYRQGIFLGDDYLGDGTVSAPVHSHNIKNYGWWYVVVMDMDTPTTAVAPQLSDLFEIGLTRPHADGWWTRNREKMARWAIIDRDAGYFYSENIAPRSAGTPGDSCLLRPPYDPLYASVWTVKTKNIDKIINLSGIVQEYAGTQSDTALDRHMYLIAGTTSALALSQYNYGVCQVTQQLRFQP